MKKLIITEKPSVARNIADAINAKIRKDGFIEGNDYVITWAFGHLLQLYDLKDYNQDLKGWRLEYFPYIPNEFKYKIKSSDRNREQIDAGAKKQVDIINALIMREDIDGIIAATDDDREGRAAGSAVRATASGRQGDGLGPGGRFGGLHGGFSAGQGGREQHHQGGDRSVTS